MKVKYFQPSEQDFKEIYGSGMMYGAELSVILWEWIEFWASGDYFSRKGKLTVSGEDTELQIIPVYGGLKFRFPTEKINPYFGFGVGYFNYKEKNPIGTVENGDMGYIGQIGCIFEMTEGFIFDIHAAYSHCTVMPKNVKANLGGFQAGIGVGFEF